MFQERTLISKPQNIVPEKIGTMELCPQPLRQFPILPGEVVDTGGWGGGQQSRANAGAEFEERSRVWGGQVRAGVLQVKNLHVQMN